MTESTELLRQVNPKFLQQGRPSSQVFKPTAKDDKKLSVYDGDLISPENAWRHYTESLKLDSAGVLAVTVGECQSLDLVVRPDPEPFPEHAIISFENCSNSQIEKKAKRLRNFALNRGWKYQITQ